MINNIISTAVLDIVKAYINNQEPFTLIINNNHNWDKALPDRLGSRFLLNMENTDLEDSYVDDNGDIVLTIGINDVVYTTALISADIHAVGPLKKEPLITKQFKEELALPVTTSKANTIPSNADIVHSMQLFELHNPQLFNKE